MVSVPVFLRKFRLVYNNLIKKLAVPFGVVSTTVLLTGFDKAHAQTIAEPILPKYLLDHKGIIPKIVENKEKVTEKINQTKEKINSVSNAWDEIGNFFLGIINWIKDIPQNITNLSIDLLVAIYDLLATFILQTPLFIFDNAIFTSTTIKFSIISIFTTILVTLFESIRKIMNKKHTDFKRIMERLPVAVFVTGISPFLFNSVFYLLNKLSSAITNIGSGSIKSQAKVFEGHMPNVIDMLVLIGFDIGLIILLYNILFQTGRRWFNLLACGVMTPLAMTAYMFDDHKHLHSKWWDTIKGLSMVQLTYSVFLCLLGLLIFGFYADGWKELGFKLLLTLGSLHALAFPPKFVLRYADNGKDTVSMAKDVKDMVTMKNFTPAIFARKKHKENKMFKEIYAEERQKSRHVDTDAIWKKVKNSKKKK